MVQSRFRPPLSPAQLQRLKEKEQHFQNTLVVRLLCKSVTLKDFVKTDNERKSLIELKNKLSKHKLYGLLAEYTQNPFSDRWSMVQKKLWGGDEEFTLRDLKNAIMFKVDYTPAGIEHRTEETIIQSRDLSCVVSSNFGVHYDMLDDDELMILFHVIIGAEDIKEKLSQIEEEQRKFKIQKRITDLY